MSQQDDWNKGLELGSEHGVRCHHQQMPNGEIRFRLIGPDGSSYIRTVAGPVGGWQNSHYHERLRETYIVEEGWIVIAKLNRETNDLILNRYAAGSIVTTQRNIAHNVYLPAKTVIHTVKHGADKLASPDWTASPDLDFLTKPIGEDVLNRLLDV